MNTEPASTNHSKAASRSLALLAAIAIAGFVVLLLVLGWLSRLTGSGAIDAKGLDFETGTVTMVLNSDAPELNSTRSLDAISNFVLGHIKEGLLQLDEHNELTGGVAERWELRADGATFHLRASAKWSDGKPVTAHDFVFAWRKGLDPQNASKYAFLLYPVKNAEAINFGKLPVEALGARAVDDRTLEVQLERPLPYFLKIATTAPYLPVREEFYNSREGRYGANAEDMLYNGPYVLSQWVHGARIRMDKNPQYWNAEAIRINAIDIPYLTPDTATILNLFSDGNVAVAGGSNGLPPEGLKRALLEGWAIDRMNDGSIWYLNFNHRPGRITSNRNFRKALQLVVDNNTLVNRALKVPGYTPSASLFPAWLQGVNGLFRQEYPPPEIRIDVEKAREHLEQARIELGLDSWPAISLLTQDTEVAGKSAEYFQDLFRQTLGLELLIDRQIFKQRLAKVEAGDFEIAIYGWGPDYDDPMTFGDLFASWNPNNSGKYNNPEYDRWVAVAQESLQAAERMQAFAEIQRIVIEDAVVITNYERGQMYLVDPRLKGVIRRAIGTDPDFTHAYIEQP